MATPVTLTSNEFDAYIESEETIVVYFWASWCEPCKTFRDVYEKVAGKFDSGVKFGKVDTEAEQQLRDDFNIRSVPTIMVFREKVALCQESGAMDEVTLTDLVEQAVKLDMQSVREKIAKDMLD